MTSRSGKPNTDVFATGLVGLDVKRLWNTMSIGQHKIGPNQRSRTNIVLAIPAFVIFKANKKTDGFIAGTLTFQLGAGHSLLDGGGKWFDLRIVSFAAGGGSVVDCAAG